MKKGLLSEEERIFIEKVESINIEKNAIKIMDNPSSFFSPYLQNPPNNAVLMLAKFCIYTIMKTADNDDKIGENISQHFSKNYSILTWLDKIESFYIYLAEDIIDYILKNHDNSVLDLYNEGHVDKEIMKKTMSSFHEIKNGFVEEKEMILHWIEEIREEKQTLKELGGYDRPPLNSF